MRGSGLGHWVSSSSSAQASLASSNCALFSRTAAIVQSITTESNHVPRTVFSVVECARLHWDSYLVGQIFLVARENI